MDRRLTIVAGLVVLVALAGCSSVGSIALTPVDNATAIGQQASLDAGQFEGAEREIVADAVAGQNVTSTGQRPALEPDRPVRYEGSVYNLSSTVVASTERPEYELLFTVDPNETGRSMAYAELPAVDRDQVPVEDLREIIAEDGPERIGTTWAPDDAAAEQSVFVPEQSTETITIDGEPVGVTVTRRGTATIHTYRYEAESLGSLAAHGESVEDRRVHLTDLTEGEREILREATGETYYEGESASEAWTRLVERFQGVEPAFETVDGGEYLVRWDGQDYWVELSSQEPSLSASPADR